MRTHVFLEFIRKLTVADECIKHLLCMGTIVACYGLYRSEEILIGCVFGYGDEPTVGGMECLDILRYKMSARFFACMKCNRGEGSVCNRYFASETPHARVFLVVR